jgi:hypothetical protein
MGGREKMTRIPEILKDADFRRPLYLSCAAAAMWVVLFIFAWSLVSSGNLMNLDISSSDRVLDYAMQFRALPRTEIPKAASAEDPLSVLSQIVDVLGLRDRVQQLQSNPSGVVIQLEKLYGDELGELLYSIENRGIDIKTAEIRALPSEGGRILNVTLMMGQAR